MPGVVVEMCWGEWAAGLFPGISDCVGLCEFAFVGGFLRIGFLSLQLRNLTKGSEKAMM